MEKWVTGKIPLYREVKKVNMKISSLLKSTFQYSIIPPFHYFYPVKSSSIFYFTGAMCEAETQASKKFFCFSRRGGIEIPRRQIMAGMISINFKDKGLSVFENPKKGGRNVKNRN
jgi:hypothetical protein